MRHDERSQQPSTYTPTCSPHILLLALGILEGNIEGLAETLAKEMRCTRLQSPSVLHESLNCKCLLGTGKSFGGTLDSSNDGNGQQFLCKRGIFLHHGLGIIEGTLVRGVGGMAFLPKEFRRAKEGTGSHLPSHYVGPLIDLQGQVAMTNNPFPEGTPNHGLTRRSDDEGILQLGLGVGNQSLLSAGVGRQPVVRHHGTFLGKSVDVFSFLAQEALGNEHGEVCVLHVVTLDPSIEVGTDNVPEGHAPGLDDHAAADGAGFGKTGVADDGGVPLGVVLGAGGDVVGFGVVVRVVLLLVLATAATAALLLLIIVVASLLLFGLDTIGIQLGLEGEQFFHQRCYGSLVGTVILQGANLISFGLDLRLQFGLFLGGKIRGCRCSRHAKSAHGLTRVKTVVDKGQAR
mmetsp:Transcript_10870/g.30529  ORF Transcript_10870/g.30529 Transcript_10870/m.30529 type:complete len:403 (+) Transcript_10870:370-1578(+)